MRSTDTEHRTLAILITVGMLLGIGLAVASPAHRQPVARVTPAAGTTQRATAAPSRTPGSRAGTTVGTTEQGADASEPDARCGRLLASGLPDDLGSGLPHAAHLLLANCAKSGGTGLPNALGHVGENDGKGQGQGHAGDRGRSEEHRAHGRIDRRGGSDAGQQVHGSDRESRAADGRGGSQGSGGKPDDAGPPPREP
jgi:hypothetical protein